MVGITSRIKTQKRQQEKIIYLGWNFLIPLPEVDSKPRCLCPWTSVWWHSRLPDPSRCCCCVSWNPDFWWGCCPPTNCWKTCSRCGRLESSVLSVCWDVEYQIEYPLNTYIVNRYHQYVIKGAIVVILLHAAEFQWKMDGGMQNKTIVRIKHKSKRSRPSIKNRPISTHSFYNLKIILFEKCWNIWIWM